MVDCEVTLARFLGLSFENLSLLSRCRATCHACNYLKTGAKRTHCESVCE